MNKNYYDYTRRAEELALRVWRLGCVAVICPHTNTRFFQGAKENLISYEGKEEHGNRRIRKQNHLW